MAWFKEVTQPDGTKIIINLDQVRGMYRSGEFTKIFFDKTQHLDVKETPAQIGV